MSTVMMGTDVAKSMKEDLIRQTEELKSQGVEPTLCILPVGARPDDLSYERGAKKRMELVGIRCQVVATSGETFPRQSWRKPSGRSTRIRPSTACLLFRPLPGHLLGRAP